MKVGDLVEWFEPTTLSGWDKSYEITKLDKNAGVVIHLDQKSALILSDGRINKKKTKELRVINESPQHR